MFSSTINEFLDREGVSVYSEQRLDKKNTRLGSLDSALLGMKFTPAVMFPGLKWNYKREYFFGISCLSIFERGEREVNTSWFESGTLKRLSRGAKYMPLLLPASHAHANLFYSTFAIGLKIQKRVCSFFNLQPLNSGL